MDVMRIDDLWIGIVKKKKLQKEGRDGKNILKGNLKFQDCLQDKE